MEEVFKHLVFAYNCTKHETMGFSPFQLMFGHQPKLPVGLAFGTGLEKEETITYTYYAKDLQDRHGYVKLNKFALKGFFLYRNVR